MKSEECWFALRCNAFFAGILFIFYLLYSKKAVPLHHILKHSLFVLNASLIKSFQYFVRRIALGRIFPYILDQFDHLFLVHLVFGTGC